HRTKAALVCAAPDRGGKRSALRFRRAAGIRPLALGGLLAPAARSSPVQARRIPGGAVRARAPRVGDRGAGAARRAQRGLTGGRPPAQAAFGTFTWCSWHTSSRLTCRASVSR